MSHVEAVCDLMARNGILREALICARRRLVDLGGEHTLTSSGDDHIQARVLFVIDQALHTTE